MPRQTSADSIFRIGKTHMICQDYAAHYSGEGRAIAYLSDGCSTATSVHPIDTGRGDRQVYTDIGSRLLVLGALHSLRQSRSIDGGGPEDEVASAARQAAKNIHGLGVGIDALSATLLSLEAMGEGIEGRISGDGWFAARHRIGTVPTWEIIQVNYPSGAPYYLRYSLDDADYDRYLRLFSPNYTIRMWHNWMPGTELDPAQSTVREMSLRERELSVPSAPFTVDQFIWPSDEFDLALAFSDGLGTFGEQIITDITRDIVPVPTHLPLTAIVDSIKGTGGSFLCRNLTGPRGAFKQFSREGWTHLDDLAIVGVFLNGVECDP